MFKFCKVAVKRDAKTEFLTPSQAPARITKRRQTAAVDETVDIEDLLDRQPDRNNGNQAARVAARRHTVEERVIGDIHRSPTQNGYVSRDDISAKENGSHVQNAEPARLESQQLSNPSSVQLMPSMNISQR